MRLRRCKSKQTIIFPERLILRIVEKTSGRVLKRIAVSMTIFAHKKNDYHFSPPLTDSNGKTVIRRSDVEREIAKTRAFWLMDYQSTLDECHPRVLVTVPSADDIQKGVKSCEENPEMVRHFGWERALKEVKENRNAEIEPAKFWIMLDQPRHSLEKIATLSVKTRVSS